MSLVFAAIAPHPPILIPTIGRDKLKEIEKTQIALQKLEEDLYLAKPDIIAIISPHGSYFSDAFNLNVNSDFESDLRDFGDLTTKLKFKGETNLPAMLTEQNKDYQLPITMISERILDHGAAVPLYYLTQHLVNISLLPIGFCDLNWKTHVEFGGLIKEQTVNTNKRVAIVASGDLSHALLTEAPAGYNAAGPEFDKKIQELLAENNLVGMLRLNPNFVHDAAECGFRSILILMGILKDMDYIYKQYSYECPFGVGYLVGNFVF